MDKSFSGSYSKSPGQGRIQGGGQWGHVLHQDFEGQLSPHRILKEGKKGGKGKKIKEKGEKAKIIKSLSYLDIYLIWGGGCVGYNPPPQSVYALAPGQRSLEAST